MDIRLNIRPTLISDLREVLAIEHHPENIHWICPYSLDRHQQVLNNNDEFHFVIEVHNNIIGFIILAITPKEDDSIEFRRIALSDKGKGIGRQVLRWIKSWAFQEKKAHRLWLDVFTDNARALHLYKSEGFVREGIKRESLNSAKGRRSQIFMSILRDEFDRI
jgi:RimJ/RimL family protein N-acetyltransferase